MKNIYKVLLGGVLAFSVSSCEEDFLKVDPTDKVSSEELKELVKADAGLVSASLDGLLAMMHTGGISGSPNSHRDLGYKTAAICDGLISGEIAMTNSSFTSFLSCEQLLATSDNTNIFGYRLWRYPYRVVKAANDIIDTFGGDATSFGDGEENNPAKQSFAKALVMRSFAYYNILLHYTKSYKADDKVIPLYIDGSTQGGPAVSSGEIAKKLIADMTKAIEYLKGYTRANKLDIDVDIAKMILAYIHAYVGNWKETYDLASSIADAGKYKILDKEGVLGGFNNVASESWMWASDITPSLDMQLQSWWGMMDGSSYSYPAFGDRRAISDAIFAQIDENDYRKMQFINDPTSIWHLMAGRKFYNQKFTNDKIEEIIKTSIEEAKAYNEDPKNKDKKKKIIPTGLNGATYLSKMRNKSERPIKDDYVYLRIEEAFLLAAEAAAALEDNANARKYLTAVLAKRFEKAEQYDNVNSLGAADLLNEVIKHSTIEFYGEGKFYALMKRQKLTVTRGTNTLTHKGKEYAYDSEEMTIPIPQNELLNNPKLKQ